MNHPRRPRRHSLDHVADDTVLRLLLVVVFLLILLVAGALLTAQAVPAG